MTVSEYFDLSDWLGLRWHSASRLRRLWKWFRSCAVEQKSDFLLLSVSWDRFVYIWGAAVIPVEPVNSSDLIVKQIMSERSRSASWLRKGNFLSIIISFFILVTLSLRIHHKEQYYHKNWIFEAGIRKEAPPLADKGRSVGIGISVKGKKSPAKTSWITTEMIITPNCAIFDLHKKTTLTTLIARMIIEVVMLVLRMI